MNFQKFASGAANVLTRAVQYTGEKLGKAEKTEYDAHFENLLHRADQFQSWTERILHASEGFLQPNPALRAEDFVFDKIDQTLKRSHVSPASELGRVLINAGNELGPGTPYGNCLIKCGEAESAVGTSQAEFFNNASVKFIRPLRNYLEEDLKTVQRERKLLEQKRLDLDACKTKLKWANNEAAKKAVKMDTPVADVITEQRNEDSIADIESALKLAESEFERQLEVTKILLDSVSSSQAYHHKCLVEFMKAQTIFYEQCHHHMQELQMQLGSYPDSDMA